MKRFIAAILSAAFLCMTLPLSVGAVSAGYSDISVFSFEDGKVSGKFSTANDKAEIVPAYAKLIMTESILSMKPILAAVTLETERDNND